MQAEELLISITQGNQKAFEQFYRLFHVRVYNICLSHLQDAADAEEVTQDVFVDVYNNASKFKGNAAVSTWLYRIAVNKSIDKIRHKSRHKRFAFVTSIFNKDTGELQHNPPEFNHPGVVYEQKEKAVKLFAAIAQLPEKQQSAFVLKQVEGLSQREVAAILEMTEKAVESLLQRAKTNLRKTLGEMYRETKD